MRVERKADVVRLLQGLAARWIRQAEVIRARLLPRALPYGFPRLEFLRHVGARYHVNYMWQIAVARFYPRIHSPVLAFLHGPTARLDQPAPFPATKFVTLVSESPRAGRHAGLSITRQSPRNTVLPAAYSLPQLAEATGVKYVPVTTPIERLRRYERVSREIIEDGVRLTAHRVIRQLKGVEELAPGAPSMVVHKVAPAVLTASRETGQASDSRGPALQTWETTHVAPWARAAEAPRINLDQLTNQVIRQIDSRMIAMRERLGKT